MRLFTTLAILACLMGCVAQAADDVPLVPISKLQKAIVEYNGKQVRVHGFIGLCRGPTCSICGDGRSIFSTCISISSWRDSGASRILDVLYQFTEVVLVGEAFDGDLGPVADCFGLRECQWGITNAEVVQLVARRAVTELLESERGDPVGPITPNPELRAAFAQDPRYKKKITGGDLEKMPAFSFSGHQNGRAVQWGYLCWDRRNGSRTAPNPSRERDFDWDSLANPHLCARAFKRENEAWEIWGHDPFFE